MVKRRIHIGTSGWSYNHWRGKFYPAKLAPSQRLAYYQKFFKTVEVNNSFYRLPEQDSLHSWYENVANDFIFSVKASRYITHMKKLRNPQDSIKEFMSCVEILDDKLGPILFQLPPKWHINYERLEAFLKMLPTGHRYTFEFRDPSWFTQQIFDLLANFKVAFCIFDLDRRLSPMQVTADFVYIRLHGPKDSYHGRYDDRAIRHWAMMIEKWHEEGREIFCYFDNDEAAYAIDNAMLLQRKLKAL